MTICFDVFSLIVKSCNEVPLVCVWQIAKASVFRKVFGKFSHGTLGLFITIRWLPFWITEGPFGYSGEFSAGLETQECIS